MPITDTEIAFANASRARQKNQELESRVATLEQLVVALIQAQSYERNVPILNKCASIKSET